MNRDSFNPLSQSYGKSSPMVWEFKGSRWAWLGKCFLLRVQHQFFFSVCCPDSQLAAIGNHPSVLGFQQSETHVAQIAGGVELEPSDVGPKGQAVGSD
jgi:hypothetical protein